MIPDCDLLRRYAETQSEDAFAELVRRHIHLVYSAAMRQVNGDLHLAQDVAQIVFTELARGAASLSNRQILTGWLYTCAHFTAAKAVRKEFRRRTHEQEARAMHEPCPAAAADCDWGNIGPILDKLMHKLKASDRDVILMRFFENRQLADIGENLGVSEDAARKRVNRALEKLRALLFKTGVTSASLAAALSANAIQVAPPSLIATVSGISVAGAASGNASVLTIAKLMSMTKLQSALVGALILASVATPLVLRQHSKLREVNAALRDQNGFLARVQADNNRLSNSLADAAGAQRLASNQLSDLLRLRGEVTRLRDRTNELKKLQDENRQLRASFASRLPTQGGAPAPSIDEALPRESWAFVGYTEPESAFQSMVWAMSHGEMKTFLASLSPDNPILQKAQGKTDEEIAAQTRDLKEFDGVTAFKVINKEPVSDDETVLTIYAFGINEAARFKLQRFGSDWKFVGPIKGEGPVIAK